MSEAQPLLTLRGIGKRFPGVVALDSINLDVLPGACHALMGENGAGKSTLGKIVAGIYNPDEGEMRLAGSKVHFASPADALVAGIGMVHQEILFCENLSVAENLSLGDTPHRGPFVDRAELYRRAESALDRIGGGIDPKARLGSLPIAQQQRVQIAGAVARGARILIFDEPTSSLSHAESERLFELIKTLLADGVTCLYVSHRLPEVFRLCDWITVLRDGKLVTTQRTSELTPDLLVRAMIGRAIEAPTDAGELVLGEEVLRVEGLSSPGKFQEVSFSLRQGEIVGMAGLVGSGRTEVAEAIFGLDPASTGNVLVKGKPLPKRNPQASVRRGLGLAPEDRKRHGLVLPMRVRENMTLTVLPRLSRGGWVDMKQERRDAQAQFDRLRVRAPGIESPTAGLSGGNQQKLVIAKWTEADGDILIVDEPTRGVDVGAKKEIHDILRALAKGGKGVIAISSELPEILTLATRILVFRAGRIVGDVPRSEATEESLIRMMTGIA